MKKLVLFLILPVLCLSQERERFVPKTLLSNGGDTAWSINGTADDTSAVFDMISVQSIQYSMTDAGGDDSVAYSIELYTTNQLKTTPDSTFVLAKTIESSETTELWRPVHQLDVALARKGYIVVTGLAGNSITQTNLFYAVLLGWSNAEGMMRRSR